MSSITADESALQAAVQSGDTDAFGVLYDRYVQAVYRYCYRHCPATTAPEDLMSVVFLEAWRCRERLVLVDGNARAWLLGIAKNVARTGNRSWRRHEQALVRHTALLERTDGDETARVLDKVDATATATAARHHIQRLPSAERDVAELCLLEELTPAQAAHVLGIRPATVRARLDRARRTLRRLLQSGDVTVAAIGSGHEHHESADRASLETLELM